MKRELSGEEIVRMAELAASVSETFPGEDSDFLELFGSERDGLVFAGLSEDDAVNHAYQVAKDRYPQQAEISDRRTEAFGKILRSGSDS